MLIPSNITFGQLLLNEIGIEPDFNGFKDQDNGIHVQMPSSVLPNRILTMYDIDAWQRNPKIISFLFNYFTNKLMNEQNIYIDVVYYKQVKNSRNLPLAVKANGKEFISKIYNNESLKYLDLICQLNGNSDVDLSRFDIINDT